MAAIQVNNTQLEYIEQGQGAPVVLVDGSLGDYRSWGLQMDALAKSYRTISYSRRYHYPNECSGNETNYSTVLHAEDLSALISGLGLNPPHLAGTSYGAYTASFMAMNHPTQVRSLVLSEPPVFNLIEQNQKGRAMRNEFLDNVWEPAKN